MKKIIYIFVIFILVLIINGLFHSIYELWQKQDLITQAKKDLDREKLENLKLKAQISKVQEKEFVEEQARNKLFLTKPGEEPVIIPPNLISPQEKKVIVDSRRNWEKWFDIFFKN